MSSSTNIAEAIKASGERHDAVIAAAGQALLEFAAMVIGIAQQLCPVDTGALAASGVWGPLQASGDMLTVIIGFTVSYALAVHERLDLHHSQGQAKFLEVAMRNLAPQWEAFAMERIRKVL